MKKPVGIRIEESLIEKIKKLALKNKLKFQHPFNFSSIVEQAIVEYLKRNNL